MWWLALVALAVLAWSLVTYNRLVALGNRADAAWSDVDVQLQRRHDLVTNLVEAVKGYAQHEREVLEKVARARSLAESARVRRSPEEAGRAETSLSGQMSRLLLLAEAYPDLKASERFLDLQRALTEVEDDLQNARRYYNAVVRDFNTHLQRFPELAIARPLGFRPRGYFSLDTPDDGALPKVEV